jgi:hypothetical protein
MTIRGHASQGQKGPFFMGALQTSFQLKQITDDLVLLYT